MGQGFAFGHTQDQIRRFQTFWAIATQPILGISVTVRKLPGAGHSDIVADLYAATNHIPSGAPLASAPISSFSVGSDWTEVNAAVFYANMTSGREYAVVLSQRTPGSAVYEWLVKSTNSLSAHFGKWDGSTYIDESSLGDAYLNIQCASACSVSTQELATQDIPVYGFGFGNSTDELKRYQTFNLFKRQSVIGLDVKLRKIVGDMQTDIVAELYRVAGDRPSGSLLASAMLPCADVRSDWTTVHIPLKSSGLDSATYAVVLSQRARKSSRYEWAVAQGSNGMTFGKWTGSTWVDESSLGRAWLRIWKTEADVVVDLSHGGNGGYGFGNTEDEIRRYQTFTSPAGDGHTYRINGIQLKLRRVFGLDQSDLVVGIYETANDHPTGSPLATAVVPSNRINEEWTTVLVPLFANAIKACRSYAITLTQRYPHASRYEWATANAGSASRFGKWNGSTWIDESSLGDGWLKAYLIRLGEAQSSQHNDPLVSILVRAELTTYTHDDNKDCDTGIDVTLSTVLGSIEFATCRKADCSSSDATEYNDWSKHSIVLNIQNRLALNECCGFKTMIQQHTYGDDTWKFAAKVTLLFSNNEVLTAQRDGITLINDKAAIEFCAEREYEKVLKPANPRRIIHISDLHFTASSGTFESASWPGGIQTEMQDSAAKSAAIASYLVNNAATLGASVILITGDLTDSGDEADYPVLLAFLNKLIIAGYTILMLPGNHDYCVEGLQALCGDEHERRDRFNGYLMPEYGNNFKYPRVVNIIDLDGTVAVRMVLLDSMQGELDGDTDNNRAQGTLGSSQLDRLQEILATPEPSAKTVIALHHSPFSVNSDGWLTDRDALLDVIAGKVDCLLFGHTGPVASGDSPNYYLTERTVFNIPLINSENLEAMAPSYPITIVDVAMNSLTLGRTG